MAQHTTAQQQSWVFCYVSVTRP